MVDSKKIKARMVELGLRQADVASKMGISRSSLNNKLTGCRPTTIDEAEQLMEILNIPDTDLKSYFFSNSRIRSTC